MSRVDYDLSCIRGIVMDVDGVLSPSTVPIGTDGRPERMINVKDSFAIRLAVVKGLYVAIISGAHDSRIGMAYARLGVDDVFTGVSEKKSKLLEWMNLHDLDSGEVAFIGDDIPDIPAMNCVGLRVAPADAAIDVRSIANYISRITGGHGVARDLIGQILASQGKWLDADTDYIW